MAWADSPLTSTSWWKRYEEKPIMQEALYDSEMNYTVMDFLCHDDAVLELRLAVVNCLSWNIDGHNRFQRLLNYYKSYVLDKWDISDEEALKKMPAKTRIVFAYLKSLDDYFDVKEAYKIALSAVKEEPKSRAVCVIAGLIGAQVAFDGNWCDVYTSVAEPVADKSLKKDFSDYAVEQIMEYIGLYECSGPADEDGYNEDEE